MSSCKQSRPQLARQKAFRASKHRFLGNKSTSSPINTGASSSYTNSDLVSVEWPGNRKFTSGGEAASLTYLTNALGQRTFKGEPKAEQYLPNQSTLGTSYIDWLKKNFAWLFAAAQTNTSVGTAFTYADQDAQLPSWALLGRKNQGQRKNQGKIREKLGKIGKN